MRNHPSDMLHGCFCNGPEQGQTASCLCNAWPSLRAELLPGSLKSCRLRGEPEMLARTRGGLGCRGAHLDGTGDLVLRRKVSKGPAQTLG